MSKVNSRRLNLHENYKSSCGLGITSTTRLHAARLCDLQNEEFLIELELNKLVNEARFTQYNKVFNRFGFGSLFQGILISHIYPFENFLDEQGKSIVIVKKGRKSKKPTKRHLSLIRFQKS